MEASEIKKKVKKTNCILQTVSKWFKKNKAKTQERKHYKNTTSHLEKMFLYAYRADPRADNVSIDDYDWLQTLGTGAYGRVDLAMKSNNGMLYAVKSFKKELVVLDIMKEFILNEKRILKSITHPFIARMSHHFVDDARLYLAMDYYPGGDMHTLLMKKSIFSEELARFYGAQIAMALDFLHSVGVVHRDLKVENVLLDQDGYVRLADFGVAEMLTSRGSREMVGTMDYMAPEMIVSYIYYDSRYDWSVDWWSYGVLMYLITTGKFPYHAPTPDEMCQVVGVEIKYPKTISKNLKELLKGLFIKDPLKRIGCNSRGIKGVRSHPWFRPLNWPALFKKELQAPYVPECSEVDTSQKRKFTCHRLPENSCPLDFEDF